MTHTVAAGGAATADTQAAGGAATAEGSPCVLGSAIAVVSRWVAASLLCANAYSERHWLSDVLQLY